MLVDYITILFLSAHKYPNIWMVTNLQYDPDISAFFFQFMWKYTFFNISFLLYFLDIFTKISQHMSSYNGPITFHFFLKFTLCKNLIKPETHEKKNKE